MRYSMYRQDGSGDSGGLSMALWLNADKTDIEYEHNARPRVGVAMRVGSLYARTMQHQDWWQTTLIQEILEETEKKVVFKTSSGKTYTWEII